MSRHPVLRFLLWVLAFAGLYYLWFPLYSKLFLTLAEPPLEAVLGRAVELSTPPMGKGFSLLVAGSEEPLAFRFDLFSVALNWIFAPALVMTTVGFTTSGVVRALAAIALMAVFHALHVDIIVLHFLADGYPLFPRGVSPALLSLIHWLYKFADKVANGFFPFLAWVIVCFDVLYQRLWGPSEAVHPTS
ncbi:MAG TPA: hypothetical protein ENK62_06280 [Chromatiales bacterium]|nr:hypothetical protein [Chromatiales bacterium]